jgi:hypothetical protein
MSAKQRGDPSRDVDRDKACLFALSTFSFRATVVVQKLKSHVESI